MLNFLSTVFNKKASARTLCGNYDGETDVIQECGGCDESCEVSCDTDCTYDCSFEADNFGGGGCTDCNGSCVNIFMEINWK